MPSGMSSARMPSEGARFRVGYAKLGGSFPSGIASRGKCRDSWMPVSLFFQIFFTDPNTDRELLGVALSLELSPAKCPAPEWF